MKFKDLFIVPIIGLGYFDEQIITDGSTWYIRTIIILFFKLQYYKRIK
jgi:hypothetical protein